MTIVTNVNNVKKGHGMSLTETFAEFYATVIGIRKSK